MIAKLARYSKTFAALATAIGVTASALADAALTTQEMAAVAVAWIGVGTVYSATNRPLPPPPPPAA